MERLFIPLQFHIEVSSERHVAESTHKDGLWQGIGSGRDSIRQLVDKPQQSPFEKRLYHRLSLQGNRVFDTEIAELLFVVRFHLDTQQFPSLTSYDRSDGSADRRRESYFREFFVDKQSIPGLDMITLFDNHFGHHPREIFRNERILPRRLYRNPIACSGFSFEIDVEAFS